MNGTVVRLTRLAGFSALHLAVLGGHLSCIKLLMNIGRANVNLADGRSGKTALHHAVETDNLAIVGHLILEVSGRRCFPIVGMLLASIFRILAEGLRCGVMIGVAVAMLYRARQNNHDRLQACQQ